MFCLVDRPLPTATLAGQCNTPSACASIVCCIDRLKSQPEADQNQMDV